MKLKQKIHLKYLIGRMLVYAFIVCGLLSIPTEVQAADYYSEGSFQYTIDADTVSIHSYFGSEETVVIPSMIAGMQVTGIDDYAFSGCSSVKSLTIPDTVIRIGDASFIGAKSLEKIYNQSKSIVPKVAAQVLVIEDYPMYVADGNAEAGTAENTDAVIDYNGNTSTNHGTSDETKDKSQMDKQNATVTGNYGFGVDAEEDDGNAYHGVQISDSKQTLSVDDSKNLILIDEDGTITVLDRNSDYAIAKKGDGTTAIVDANGDEIQITDERIINQDGDTIADIDESNDVNNPSEKGNQKNTVVMIVVLCVAAVMVLAGVLFLRKRKQYEKN